MAWASARASAAEPGPFRLALNLGSLGIGPEIGYQPSRWFGVRASGALLSIGHRHRIDDIRYDAKLRLRNYALMGDLYPFANGWRLSAGVGGNGNRLRLKAMPMAPVRVGNTTYTPDQIGTLRGELTTRDYAPIATIGYGGSLAGRFLISGDIGVMFHGRPQMGLLTSTGSLISPADLAIERDKIQSDIARYRFYPVLQITAGYRFSKRS